MSTFLSVAELQELTGYQFKSKQAEWLKSNRFSFTLNRFKVPLVSRAHFEERMGHSRATKSAQPNWAALHA